ncbi:MAG: aminotransferase class V-fold PLP-dependent enzyme [Planctomyces sp.]|nr:aminotransferase class V-fold PLP-dependent enzyme [Planctomyces sp.]
MLPDDVRRLEAARAQWPLADGIDYLNHGSFGPAPLPVLEAQARWTAELQRNPMEFFVRRLDGLLDDAAERLARFVGCRGGDLAFVPNATVGMNIVADSLALTAGDEVLLNDHEYGAVLRIWRRRCDETGAKVVAARFPRPLTSPEEIVDRLFADVTPRTRMIVVSHITSPTAVVLPVEAICRRARDLGIPVSIDGPHAIAMRPVALRELGCDYYCASCHKWLSAPFGSGFLYVRGGAKAELRPPILSWGRSLCGRPSTWKDEFHWFGTYQPAAALAIPAAIEFLEAFGHGRFRELTHEMARAARNRLISELDAEPLTPDSPDWYGSMATLRLPWLVERSGHAGQPHPLQLSLATDSKIEIPIVEWGGDAHVRVSCHLYHTPDQIDRLIAALCDWRARTGA